MVNLDPTKIFPLLDEEDVRKQQPRINHQLICTCRRADDSFITVMWCDHSKELFFALTRRFALTQRMAVPAKEGGGEQESLFVRVTDFTKIIDLISTGCRDQTMNLGSYINGSSHESLLVRWICPSECVEIELVTQRDNGRDSLPAEQARLRLSIDEALTILSAVLFDLCNKRLYWCSGELCQRPRR